MFPPNLIEQALPIINDLTTQFYDIPVDDLDERIDALQEELSVYAAESGIDRELDYDPEAYWDTLLGTAAESINWQHPY